MTDLFSFNHFCRSPWYGLKVDLPAAVDAVARAGFDMLAVDYLSLGQWKGEGGSVRALARRMRDAGLAAGPLAACAMIDGSAGALAQLEAAARDGEALGTAILQVNVTGPDRQARAAAVAAACERTPGLRLALEFMPISGLSTLAETLDIVEAVGPARAGALVDVWHLSHDPDGWSTLETAPPGHIAYVEIDDALPPTGDDVLAEMMDRRTFPGEGVLDVGRFARTLRNRGFSGVVSVEILSRAHLADPLGGFAARALSTARGAWDGGNPA